VTLARHPSGAKIKYKLETFLPRLGSEPRIILLVFSYFTTELQQLSKNLEASWFSKIKY
jgi:hypothetical protein